MRRFLQEYLQFMTGHTTDRNKYLQLGKKPAIVLQEWLKWKGFVEATLVNEATRMELAARDEQNKELAERLKVLEEKEQRRQEPDSYMDRLFEDPEVLAVIKRRARQLKLKT